MPSSRRAAVLVLSAALAALAGCAAPARTKTAPAPRALSVQQRTADDQDFYRAVTAYVQGDYVQADSLLKSILRKDPGNKDAWSLRRRVVAAERLSAR